MSRDRYPGSNRLRTYRDATAFLESLVRNPPRTRAERESIGLFPIESLLARIGNPHHGIRAIHITGSKGKGSTALHTEALLAAADLRTGTFTSPHLEDWNERIRIAEAPIDETGFVEALERVRPHIAALHRADAQTAPAFFDALVAAAFSVFADARVDIAVVEAGIGARLDPTRVCRAIATCVTSVELEHTDRLGPTIADIAREKAAIARPGVPLVVGSIQDAAWVVLEREASRAGASLQRLGREITIHHGLSGPTRNTMPDTTRTDQGGGPASGHTTPRLGAVGSRRYIIRSDSRISPRPAGIALAGRTIPVALRQPGPHMLRNAALALALANEVGALSRLDDATASGALEDTVLPGRAEVLREAPLVIADGAHTRASIEALLEILDAQDSARLVAVVSITRGKNAADMLSPLVQRAHTVIAATAEPSRSLLSRELASTLEASHPCTTITGIDSPDDAIRAAIRIAGRDGTVCVTGSMYMAGAARRILPDAGPGPPTESGPGSARPPASAPDPKRAVRAIAGSGPEESDSPRHAPDTARRELPLSG